jgi:hypothetical protein
MASGQNVTVGFYNQSTLEPGNAVTIWNTGVPFRPDSFFRLALTVDPNNNLGAAVEIADTNDAGGRGGEVVWLNNDRSQTPAITVINRSTQPTHFYVNYLIAPG